MSMMKRKNRCLGLLLLMSVVLNICLCVAAVSKEPFAHSHTTWQEFFINGVRAEYDYSQITHEQAAGSFARDVWEKKFSRKDGRGYEPVSGEKLDIFYLHKLDCWVVKTDQTVGRWERTPYMVVTPDQKIAFAFLSPVELLD